ncbi:MAG: hypothetical protein HYT80_04965 [Euryarchaeota archaeon]|nr:hypothetical protein [Euryarchaeota archaeon]
MVDWVTLAFAFGLGVGSFFSPCSVALVPAYLAYYVGVPAGAEAPGFVRGLQGGARFGLAASLGAFLVFGGAGAVIYWLRTATGVTSPQLTMALAAVAILVALAVIAMGVLLLGGRDLSLTFAVKAPTTKTVPSMVGFGAAYSLASLGCSGPLFLAAMAQVFSQGALGGLLVLVFYGLGLGAFLFLSALVLSVAQERGRNWIRAATRYVKPASAVVMILAGLYVISYYVALAPAF